MGDKIEETIKAIAARHGIAVGRDDPILILQTLNERLMQDSEAAQRKILDGFASQIEAVSDRWKIDAKEKAERSLNAALAASREAMTQSMTEGTRAAAEAMRREFDASVSKLAAPLREARRVSMLNMVAAALAVVAAAVALLAVSGA